MAFLNGNGIEREGMKEMGSNKKEKGIFCILSPALQNAWQEKHLKYVIFPALVCSVWRAPLKRNLADT